MKLFSTSEAAKYLGLSLPGIKYHLRKKHLAGQLVGHSLAFTKKELDQFNKTKRGPGRPKKDKK